jgi:hypothetical protein
MSANPGIAMMNRAAGLESTEPRWKALYMIGGVAALIVVALWTIEIAGVAMMGPPPDSVLDWFALYQKYGALGLFDTFLLDAVAAVFTVQAFLALYVALRRDGKSLMAIAAIVMLIGSTILLTLNASLSMYYLSGQYAAATADAQRALIVATGQVLLESAQNGTGATMTYVLPSIAGLIASVVMLRGSTFGRATAFLGIAANAIQLAEPPTAFAPAGFYEGNGIGVFMMLISFVFFAVWYVLIGLRLLRLGRSEAGTPPQLA